MNATTFDALAVRLGAKTSRRRVVQRLAQAGGAAALAAALGRRSFENAAAQSCAYGPGTCASGYVWREAFPGDLVCVDPSQRDQAAADNAAAPSRVDPNGAYGPLSCVSGYVWRDAYDGDAVCVEPWVRDQVAYDNSQAAARIAPGCGGQTGGDPSHMDSDGDSLNDAWEMNVTGTDPYNYDTDGDGMGDGCDNDPLTPYNGPEPLGCVSQG